MTIGTQLYAMNVMHGTTRVVDLTRPGDMLDTTINKRCGTERTRKRLTCTGGIHGYEWQHKRVLNLPTHDRRHHSDKYPKDIAEKASNF